VTQKAAAAAAALEHDRHAVAAAEREGSVAHALAEEAEELAAAAIVAPTSDAGGGDGAHSARPRREAARIGGDEGRRLLAAAGVPLERGGGQRVCGACADVCDAAAAAVAQAARAFGDVVLQADGYTGSKAEYLGVFELQVEVVQGRPTYKKRGAEESLFYSTAGKWTVRSDNDTSDPKGVWKATSGAMTPGAITEAWQIHDGSAWVDVRAAKIVKRR
jgi:hypothetical protein